ncbi:hypothetical protein BYT27DRAFT_7177571 [Phlegmacium glaucopus]|nr:hypothetical protein BYT27DRAFT_7177571 [Phlegmacium glaucopus]
MLPGSSDQLSSCCSDVDALVSPTFLETAAPTTSLSSILPPCVFPFSFAPSAEAVALPKPMMDDDVTEVYRAQSTATQTQNTLMAENTRLREEVEVLRQCLRVVSTLHESSSASGSLMPSSSTSSTKSTCVDESRSSVRPTQYPFEVLWSITDCHRDSHACPSKSNPSRPPMHKALRHADGTLLSKNEYGRILLAARHLAADLLHLIPPKDKTQKCTRVQEPTRTYFSLFHHAEWMNKIDELERLHPLVGLCFDHWKAEHMLGSALLSKQSIRRRRKGPDDFQTSRGHGVCSTTE